MDQRRKLSDETIEEVLRLKESGMSCARIGEIVHRARSTVWWILRHYGNVPRRRRSPSKASGRRYYGIGIYVVAKPLEGFLYEKSLI